MKTIRFPNKLTPTEVDSLSGIFKKWLTIRKGDHLFRQGDPLENLYVIRYGSVKSYIIAEDGIEQVVEFHFPGEFLNLDAMWNHRHHSSAIAMEHAGVCLLSFKKFNQICAKIPRLQDEFLAKFGKEISDEQNRRLLFSQKRPDKRLAVFLLDLSIRLNDFGDPVNKITLNMSRSDIGNYLGLAAETVSRIFTGFHRAGFIEIDSADRKRVVIKNMPYLRNLAYNCANCSDLATG